MRPCMQRAVPTADLELENGEEEEEALLAKQVPARGLEDLEQGLVGEQRAVRLVLQPTVNTQGSICGEQPSISGKFESARQAVTRRYAISPSVGPCRARRWPCRCWTDLADEGVRGLALRQSVAHTAASRGQQSAACIPAPQPLGEDGDGVVTESD